MMTVALLATPTVDRSGSNDYHTNSEAAPWSHRAGKRHETCPAWFAPSPSTGADPELDDGARRGRRPRRSAGSMARVSLADLRRYERGGQHASSVLGTHSEPILQP